MIKKIALFVFILVFVLDLIGIIFKIESLLYIFKPFIMLSLLFLYSKSVFETNKWYTTALIFSFFGDVFLMYPGQLPFKIGLVSFLIAHILFIKIVIHRIEKVSFISILTAVIPFGTVLLALIFTIKDSIGELLLPVVFYGITISAFGTVSLIDYLNTKSKKSLFMLLGAIVFMLSDSLLAINKFYFPIEIFGSLVMVTYIAAQYLIYRSMILENEKSSN
ncbi:MAG: lysoplasmalogenase [Lutibacter sp.]|nr:lysoplasmalogenase [Lutibacter sp.]